MRFTHPLMRTETLKQHMDSHLPPDKSPPSSLVQMYSYLTVSGLNARRCFLQKFTSYL